MNLSCFQKPSRYINNEINAIKKDAELKVCLAFPDIYDIGMSHLGLKILYKIINDLAYASAERVFHPWLDMAEEMKNKGIPLLSLESKTPLSSFDIIGFSLQYELSYTAILNMLYLSAIPLRADERDLPLIIAGGPCTVNPLPMSSFIDAFLVGDGESAIKDILETVLRWKREGDRKKGSLLKALSQIEGMYVPSISPDLFGIKRRFIASINDAPYPLNPIVPYTEIVHDRLNIEVSRGCSMGCRFCQAGMIYRPLRERTPEKVLEIAEASLKRTGYGEVSFSSLSAGDYSQLLPLLKEFNKRFKNDKISVSLPSLRVKAINESILREISSIRKTGFTIAPEAGTERLRAVINKDFYQEDYEMALRSLFKEGWHNLKLYFMLGLPSETDTDIESIPKMVFKALKIAKSYTRRFVNISVSLAPFVPRPHTPFQWFGQEEGSELRRKMDYLKSALKGMNIKGHDEHMSMLEAALSRGDERLGALIETAYKEGSVLPAWKEAFDFTHWLKAMEITGIDAFHYAKTRFNLDDELPWDIIDTGIKKSFLRQEYDSALKGEVREDCMRHCLNCGLNCKSSEPPVSKWSSKEISDLKSQNYSVGAMPTKRFRVEFSKTGPLCYLSHRELINHITRAIRRAGINLYYSKGFHPSPRLSFSPPLNVGVKGLKEYFDMEVIFPYKAHTIKEILNSELKDSVHIRNVVSISQAEPSLQSFICRYEYEIICPDEKPMNYMLKKKDFLQNPLIEALNIAGERTVRLLLREREEKKVRLNEVIKEVFGMPAKEFDITRLSVYGFNGEWVLPIGEEIQYDQQYPY